MKISMADLRSNDMHTKLQNDGLDLIVGDPDDLLSIEWVMISSEGDHLQSD